MNIAHFPEHIQVEMIKRKRNKLFSSMNDAILDAIRIMKEEYDDIKKSVAEKDKRIAELESQLYPDMSNNKPCEGEPSWEPKEKE